MLDLSGELEAAVEVLRASLPAPLPEAAIITGSGLGGLAEQGSMEASLAYGEIPGLPEPKVPGHGGTVGVLELGEGRFLFFNGRSHLYEGHPAWRLGMAVRIAAAAGVKTLVSACAAGSLKPEIYSGRLLVVTDHINMAGSNPLMGVMPLEPAVQFPDTSGLYEPELIEAALAEARRLGIVCGKGVYAWVSGPSYETPAESRMLAGLGASVVGMSLVPETLTAAQLGLRLLAVACVTNVAPGLGGGTLSHGKVVREAEKLAEPLGLLISGLAPVLSI